MNDFQTTINKIDITKKNKEEFLALKGLVLNLANLEMLIDYYYQKKKRADQLVIDDEFVGYTYHNLDTIADIINDHPNSKKLVKCRKNNY